MAKLDINGKVYDVQVEDTTPLLWVIREQVGLTGTKYGCGVAQCGACSVHVNGEVVRSCSYPVRRGDGDRQTCAERGPARRRARIQREQRGSRRGVTAIGHGQSAPDQGGGGAAAKTPDPSDAQINEAITNICRCGTYQRIRAGIHMAATAMKSAAVDPDAVNA